MPPPGPYKILFIYLLIYFKLVYSNDQTGESATLPSYEELYPNSLIFSIKGNTAYHFHYFMKIFRFEDNWVLIYSGKGEQTHVNVSSRDSSSNYDCVRDGNLYTYTPKENVLFNMVNIGPTQETAEVIWAITGCLDYANKVVYDESDPNNLVVITYHVNGVTKMFIKSTGDWEERAPKDCADPLTQDKIEIRIRTETGMPGVIIDKDDNYLRYTFEEGTRCLGIEYAREQLLKTFDTYPNAPYPESVLFAFQVRTAIIEFKDSMDILRLYNNRWILIYSGKGEQTHVNVSSRNSSSTHDCVETNELYTYTPRYNKLFNKVLSQVGTAAEEVIFKMSDILEMATVVKYDETDPKNLVLKILQLNGMIRTFKKSSCGTWNESISQGSRCELTAFRAGVRPLTHSSLFKAPELQLDQSKIRIFAQDPGDPKKTVECDVSMYTIEIIETVMVTYELNDGVDCVEVRYDDKVAWKHNRKIKEYPKSVHFLLLGPVVVGVSDDLFYIAVRRANGEFESVTMGKFDLNMDVKLMAVDSKLESVVLDRNNFDFIAHKFFVEYRFPFGTKCEAVKIKDEFPWMYDDSIYPEYPSVVYLFANQVLVLCGGTAFIQRFDPNDLGRFYMPREIIRPALAGFKFEKRKDYLFYEMDSRVKCVGVNYEGKPVWKPNEPNFYGPYPDHVALFTRGNTAVVIFGDQWDILRFDNNEWDTVFTGRPRPINLHIGGGYSNRFKYKKTGKIHTYTPKGNYLFNAVKMSNRIFGSETMVWKTERLAEWATKVVYDKRDQKNELRIHGVDGMIKTFNKSISGEWEETEVKDSGSALASEKVEIRVEGQASDPGHMKITEPTTFVAPPPEDQVSEKHKEPEPLLDSETRDGTDTEEPIYEQNQDETESVEGDELLAQGEISVALGTYDTLPSGRTRVDLDIRTRTSTKQYEYSQSYGFWTYTAKDGCYFGSVRDGSTIIYKRSIAGSPVKVIAEVDASSSLVGLTLHLVSNETKRYKFCSDKFQQWINKGPSGLHPDLERMTTDNSTGTFQKQIDRSSSLTEQECVS